MTDDFERWKREVVSISPAETLVPETASPHYPDADAHMKELKRQTDDRRESDPVILWNTRPAPRLNLLHAVYLTKLRQLQRAGFRVVILVFDKYHREVCGFSGADATRSEKIAFNFVDGLFEYGIDPERTEVLLETNLRYAENLEPMDLIETMVLLANSIRDLPPSTTGSGGSDGVVPSEIIRSPIEIYYESIVDCDAILAGKSDVRGVWRMLRNVLVTEQLFESYEEPLLLGAPSLRGLDDTFLSPVEDDNSIHLQMSKREIRSLLERSKTLRRTAFECLVLQEHPPDGMPLDDTSAGTLDALEELRSETSAADLIATELYQIVH